jgi:hypothetical protein
MQRLKPENKRTLLFGPEMKVTHQIHSFGPNSDVLVRFGHFCYCAENHDGVAFNVPIWAGNEMMHRFAPETKGTHPIHFFGPNTDVLVHFYHFDYCAENHAGVAFNTPFSGRK